MRDELTEEQRSALDYLSYFLGQIGSANDAEDHGYLDEARRLRKKAATASAVCCAAPLSLPLFSPS